MPTLPDNQFERIESATNSVADVADKLRAGDTTLTPAEASAFTKAYDAWKSGIDSMH